MKHLLQKGYRATEIIQPLLVIFYFPFSTLRVPWIFQVLFFINAKRPVGTRNPCYSRRKRKDMPHFIRNTLGDAITDKKNKEPLMNKLKTQSINI